MAARDTKTTVAKKGAQKKSPRAEGEQLREYEMVLIINPELAEEKLNAALNNITQLIAGMGGVVADIKQWGRRKLAYPIKKFSEGNYVLVRFQLQPSFSKEIEAKLRISEEVLRHLLVRLNS